MSHHNITLAADDPRHSMRADARRNYDRILATADAVFMEEGPNAALEDVARRAEVGIGTLYRHFPTRMQLLEAVLRESHLRLHEEAGRYLEMDDPAAAVDAYILLWLRQTAVYRGVSAECMIATLDPNQPVSPCRQYAMDDLQHLLERAQQAGQIRPDVTYMEVWRLLSGFVMGVRDGEVDIAAARVMLDVILQGLRTRETV